MACLQFHEIITNARMFDRGLKSLRKTPAPSDQLKCWRTRLTALSSPLCGTAATKKTSVEPRDAETRLQGARRDVQNQLRSCAPEAPRRFGPPDLGRRPTSCTKQSFALMFSPKRLWRVVSRLLLEEDCLIDCRNKISRKRLLTNRQKNLGNVPAGFYSSKAQ